MAESKMTVKIGLDVTGLISGLRDAADHLDAMHATQQRIDASTVTLAEALDEVESMVTQHCYPVGDLYETGALSANRDAFDLLVRAGRAEYVGEPYGRMAVIRLTRPLPVVTEPVLDPDCRDGKHGSCMGGVCECSCHGEPT